MKKPMANIAALVTPPPCYPLAKRLPEMKWSLVLIALMLLGGVRQVGGFILGPTFMYHGRLQISGGPVNGSYDLTFALYTNNSGGTAVAGPLTNSAITIHDGVFSARLDFGAGVFDGTAYWLEIGVRTNAGGTGDFTILSPRHELTATPYAVYAENARAGGLTGTIPTAVLKGTYGGTVNFTNPANTFVGDGSALAGVNALTLGGLGSSSFWSTTGNAGTSPGVNFLGTTDNEPLNLAANNQIGFQLQYWSSGIPASLIQDYGINVLGGFWGNAISNNATGATIAGGGYVNSGLEGLPPVRFSVSYPNTVTGNFGTVGGGWGNTAGAAATVPGGTGNLAGGTGSFAAGQYARTARDGAFVWGDGTQNPFNGAGVDNAFSVLSSGGVFLFNGKNGVHIDGMGNNDGALDFGLKFGGALDSGEGIASKRTSGGNQYGLDFYTTSNNRMSIDSNGKVGINTTTPSQRLEVNGNYVLIDGGTAGNGSGQISAYIGGNGSGSDVQVGSMNPAITAVAFWNTSASAWMHIGCSSITIHGGADLAEPFAMAEEGREIPQGAVVVIDDKNPGQLRMSDQPYDSRVAGVVSGANGINPGIQLQQQGALDVGKNVALSGRVYVQADTINGAIKPGDLLTTASTPGHAMKATDHLKAQGAILGKAMTGLSEGKGMVLVLVTLQ